MSDWGSESIIAGFPRAGMTYYIQFIQEPRVVTKDGKYGTWTELALDLQFFAIDKNKEFHYMSSCSAMVKPCAMEELTCFGPDIVTRLIEVKGFEHGKHVDLELVDSWDRIPAKIAPITKPESGPLKPAAAAGDVISSSERGQPGAGGEQLPIAEPASPTPPAIIPICPICGKQATEFDNMWVHCGERVR